MAWNTHTHTPILTKTKTSTYTDTHTLTYTPYHFNTLFQEFPGLFVFFLFPGSSTIFQVSFGHSSA